MAKTTLRLKTKTLTAVPAGVQVFTAAEAKFIHSLALECHPTSTIVEAWVGASGVTTTNKDGRPISATVPFEAQARMKNGGGGIASLIDPSSIYVAQATGGTVLVSYMEAKPE